MSRRFSILAMAIALILSFTLVPSYAQKGNNRPPRNNQSNKSKIRTTPRTPADKLASAPVLRNLSILTNEPVESTEAIVMTPHPYSRSTIRLIPQVGHAVAFAVTPPVSSFKPETESEMEDADTQGLEDEHEMPEVLLNDPRVKPDADGALLKNKNLVTVIPAPSLAFNGQGLPENATVGVPLVFPPDTNGDVGPNHYVETVNLTVGIYDKTGAIQPGSPFRMGTLFAALGATSPCFRRNDGDPVVLYDQLSDRWIISQFAVLNPFHECIAVSQTGDPTGAYFAYDFLMPGGKFNDYPHMGVGSDAYYMTDHQFNAAGTAFLGSGAFAFDKAKMLVGDPTAGFIYFDLQPLDPALFGQLMPDTDGLNPPEPGHSYVFQFLATERGYGLDGIRIYDFTYDFATPANSTFVERADSPIVVPSFDPTLNESASPLPPGCAAGFSARDDMPQPAPATNCARLDGISDRLLHKVESRNFGSHTDFVMNHTVDVTPTDASQFDFRGGVRVYKLRLQDGTFSLQQAFTLSPDTDDRFMGSVAMDANGNMGIGYTVTSLVTAPSVRYAGVTESGTYLGEGTIQAGGGSQLNTGSRWGDYSSMSVDPTDECSFWYTNEYYTQNGPETCGGVPGVTACWKTKIGKFTLGTDAACATPATGTINGQVTNSVGAAPLSGAIVTATNTANSGSITATTDGTGNYSRLLLPGNYNLVASKPGFVPSAPVNITLAAAGTITTNFSLTPLANLAVGTVTVDDSASNNNGAPDPNECDHLTVQLTNSGPGDATGISATLSTTSPNVTIPAANATQSYPNIPSGGNATNATPFDLSVSPAYVCGTPINLTLTVTTDAGTSVLTFALNAPILFNYTGAAVPVPDNNLAGVPIPITVSGVPGTGINKVTVSVRATHTFDGDLDMRLIGPDGITSVDLSSDNGAGGDNFGTDCPADGNDTTFDDSAATAITAGAAPFVGTFRPETVLSAMNTQTPNGVWTLLVDDDAGGDTGTIDCWAIKITPNVCDPGTGVCAGSVPVLQKVSETVSNDTNADGNVDTNECFDLNVDLGNIGTASATGITASLSTSNPDVAILNGASSYGDIAAGANGTTVVPFQLKTSLDYPCTVPIDLTLDVTTAEGNFSFPITLPVDFSHGVPQTFDYSGPPVPVPDNNAAGAIAQITVSGVPGTAKLSATLHVTQTFDGDDALTLIGPDGVTTVALSLNNGGAGLGYGTDCPADANDTTFDSNAATVITAGTPPYVGTFRPQGNLDVFNGTDPNGVWTLKVVDSGPADTGNIECWSLTITPPGCENGGCVTCGTVTINPPTVPDGNTGQPYSQQLTASETLQRGTPFTFSVSAGSLPPGLTLSSSGLISGSPTTNGSYSFTVTATDSDGCSGDQAYTINVTCPIITFSPPTLPNGSVGVAYNQTVTASGTVAPFTYSVSAGTLPPGLALNTANGNISGTPTTLGTFNFSIGVVDSNGCTGSQAYSITITTACGTIVLSPSTLPNGSTGTAYSQTISASGGTGPYTFAVTTGTLPTGLTLNSGTGDITGTPTAAGTFNFTVTATDSNTCTGSQAYSITITTTCGTIVVSPATLPDGTIGTAYTATVSASGGTGPYTFAVTTGSLPAGLTLNGSTGDITGTPTATGTSNFVVTATDATSCTGAQSYSITIAAACLFCDDFNDGTLALNWTYIKTWTEGGGNLNVTATKKASAAATPVFAGCQTCTIQTSIMSTGGGKDRVWVLGWYVDAKNRMELLFKEKANKAILKQRVNNHIKRKASGVVNISPNTVYTVNLSFDGTQFELEVDGNSILTLIPNGAVPTGTVGFMAKHTTASFDFISVN